MPEDVRIADQRVAAVVTGWRDIARDTGFSGEMAIGHVYFQSPVIVSAAQNADGTQRTAGQKWRWASVTKQVVATLLMQQVDAGTIDLGQPISRYLPDFASANAGTATVEQVLRHQSGFPNPSTAADDEEIPAFYRPDSGIDPLTYCAGAPTGQPGGEWSYNNCDYIVLGALLERVAGQPWRELVAKRIAEPAGISTLGAFPASEPTVPGFSAGAPEAAQDLAQYGASGALYGTPADMVKFDLALLSGKLLGPDALEAMWNGQPDLGYMALGQWVFEVPLKGCEAPVRVVERRGAIGGVQVRNFILPMVGVALSIFTDQGEGDFDFGEVWQGAGFSHDMLSLAACEQEPA
ncbi:class A beta-lactamase-related serine hydrolase [Alteriqipengyuania lutimaris]|uniref:Class A beta-lactamase-related serine hydrolase n=1 Tax=Alteriqipengyuania lutimaris TaxID=1538146 RepID=A0A395LM14_9SPHN|nr:class A beta-lactamase-related serine hydrolase [Alteriqipengyuania lutimaris]